MLTGGLYFILPAEGQVVQYGLGRYTLHFFLLAASVQNARAIERDRAFHWSLISHYLLLVSVTVQSLTATTAAAPLTAGSGTQGLVDDTDVLQPSHFEPQHVSAVDMFGQGSQPARHFIVGATQQDVQLSQEFTVFSVPGELLSDLKDAFQVQSSLACLVVCCLSTAVFCK